MPIIIPKAKIEREQIRISIEKPLIEKITQYCDWAGVKKPDEFFEQAALYILSKDKDWLHYMQEKHGANR
jgi:hypothetical protein